MCRERCGKYGLGAQKEGPGWRYNVCTISREVITETMGVDNVAQREEWQETTAYQRPEEHLRGSER